MVVHTYTLPSQEDLDADIEAYNADKEAYDAENDYTMYALGENTIPLFVGATIGNGNFVDDVSDLNANEIVNVFVSSEEVPPFCVLCEDGSLPTANSEGKAVCPATCSNCGVPAQGNSMKWPAIAGALLVGLFLRRRRR